MTLAQERLAKLIEWFVASSAQRRQPCGGPVPVGPYAVVVPVEDLDAPPPLDHDPMALVLYVPAGQADGV